MSKYDERRQLLHTISRALDDGDADSTATASSSDSLRDGELLGGVLASMAGDPHLSAHINSYKRCVPGVRPHRDRLGQRPAMPYGSAARASLRWRTG